MKTLRRSESSALALALFASAALLASCSDEKTPPAERAALVQGTRERANAQLTAAVVLAGMTAVVWGVNVADAWLSGVDTESLDAALAKN